MSKTTAYALAGLGGFNAHGAGFLQAAKDTAQAPDLVTCTSGQILVLANYLAGAEDMRAGLLDAGSPQDPFAQLQTLLFGMKGVFRPAIGEALARFFQPPAFTDSMVDIFADRFLPAQLYAPDRPDAVIDKVVETFNASDVGVVFNAYDPRSGLGILYGNDAARGRFERTTKLSLQDVRGLKVAPSLKSGASEAPLLPIDATAVKSALWLSLYGFEGAPEGRIDGAYLRSCIVSELHNFDRVIIARPLARGWVNAPPPRSYFDVQDWNTEMWFSAAYKAEIDAMVRINQLVERGKISDPDFRFVELHEVAPETPAGYFNFFVEREGVFEAARLEAEQLFKGLDNPSNRSPQ
jgi:hypothetical protein